MRDGWKRIIQVAVAVAIAAGAVRIGMAVRSPGSGCKPGPDPVPKNAPASPDADGPQGLRMINLDGSGERAVSTGGWEHASRLSAIAWSPDRQRVATVSDFPYQLTIRRVDGTEPRIIVEQVADPAWSPDGVQIAFKTSGLEVINVDGTGRRQIVPPPLESGKIVSEPAWSPDGTTIAYASNLGTIEIVNVDGTDRRTITTQRNFNLSRPAWSPDGTRIVFAAHGGYYGSWLGIARADGSGTRRIAGHCGGSHPVWSPDGATIAYEDAHGLNTIPVHGHRPTRIPNSWGGHLPTWSTDGNQLLYYRI